MIRGFIMPNSIHNQTMFIGAVRGRSLPKSLSLINIVRHQTSPPHMTDSQHSNVTMSRQEMFLNTYFYNTPAKYEILKSLFNINLYDSSIFGHRDIPKLSEIFYISNNLPVEVEVNERSILRDQLSYRLDRKFVTITKKQMFFNGINCMKSAYLEYHKEKEMLDANKTIREVERENNIDVQQLLLQVVYQRLKTLPSKLILSVYRDKLINIETLYISKCYKDLELIIALYGYIAMIVSKSQFLLLTKDIIIKMAHFQSIDVSDEL